MICCYKCNNLINENEDLEFVEIPYLEICDGATDCIRVVCGDCIEKYGYMVIKI